MKRPLDSDILESITGGCKLVETKVKPTHQMQSGGLFGHNFEQNLNLSQFAGLAKDQNFDLSQLAGLAKEQNLQNLDLGDLDKTVTDAIHDNGNDASGASDANTAMPVWAGPAEVPQSAQHLPIDDVHQDLADVQTQGVAMMATTPDVRDHRAAASEVAQPEHYARDHRG